MTDPIVSHGRGGMGNIAADGTPYTDGEIIREGPTGASTGRGGQGNISAAGLRGPVHRDSQEVIPESAMRPSMEDHTYHTGRGGEGNAHFAKPDQPKAPAPAGLADRLKNWIMSPKKTSGSTGT